MSRLNATILFRYLKCQFVSSFLNGRFDASSSAGYEKSDSIDVECITQMHIQHGTDVQLRIDTMSPLWLMLKSL